MATFALQTGNVSSVGEVRVPCVGRRRRRGSKQHLFSHHASMQLRGSKVEAGVMVEAAR